MASDVSPHRVGRLFAPKTTAPPTRHHKSASRGGRRGGRDAASPEATAKITAARHKFAASLFRPPGDFRGHDCTFNRIFREIAAEFQPRSFTQIAAIASLAADYERLARVREMMEALQEPSLDSDTLDAWKTMRTLQKDLAAIKCALRLGSGSPCPAARARRAARLVAASINGIQETLAEAAAEEAEEAKESAARAVGAGDQPDASKAAGSTPEPQPPAAEGSDRNDSKASQVAAEAEEELRLLKELMQLVEPVRDTLTDRARLTALLCSRRHICLRIGRPLHAVLLYIAQCKRLSLSLRDGPKRKMERRNNVRRMELAYDPKPLIQLQKLQAEVERAIEQKLRRLEKTKS